MKAHKISQIVDLLNECRDVDLIDLVLKLLLESSQ